jgi:CO dehydrogenase maturation factor
VKIAVTGKGGVGKTFISGILAYRYAATGFTTIAIDADSSPNLALVLGMTETELEKIVPVAENQLLIEEKTMTGYPGVYKLAFSVDDIVRHQAVLTPSMVSLLVMGTVQAVGSGCACAANSLVRNLVGHLITRSDEVVIMDMEAGIEHLGRGTAENVDMMLIVTDANKASLVTAGRIVKLARGGGIPRMAVVANRVRNKEQEEKIKDAASLLGVPVPVIIPYDEAILDAGTRGVAPVFMDTPATRAIECLRTWIEEVTTS